MNEDRMVDMMNLYNSYRKAGFTHEKATKRVLKRFGRTKE